MNIFCELACMGKRMANCACELFVSTHACILDEPGHNYVGHRRRTAQPAVFRAFSLLTDRPARARFVLTFAFVCLCFAVPPFTAIAQDTLNDDAVIRVNTELLLFPVRMR